MILITNNGSNHTLTNRSATLSTVVPKPMVLNEIKLKLLARLGVLNFVECLKKLDNAPRVAAEYFSHISDCVLMEKEWNSERNGAVRTIFFHNLVLLINNDASHVHVQCKRFHLHLYAQLESHKKMARHAN
jgi:hypothetical protein